MTLEIQICTFGAAGLERVGRMKLPQVDDVIYTVCFQNPDGAGYSLPHCLERPDVRILEHSSRGLSNNRNFGIENAIGDIILISDDDLEYTREGLEEVIDVFEKNPSLAFATFRQIGDTGKYFPPYGFEFGGRTPKNYYLTSFELALRREMIPEDIRFSPNLGIGAPIFGAGEENMFLYRLIGSGNNGRYFPVEIVRHIGVTTGLRTATPSFLRAQGTWFRVRYGFVEGALRVIRDSFHRGKDIFGNLRYLFEGFFKAPKYFNSDGSDKLSGV